MDRVEDSVATRCYENLGNEPLLALVTTRPGRALDCGCGAGDNARLLVDRGWRVTGVTLSPREQEAAAAWCDAVVLADLNEPLPESVGVGYDLILLSHVLEHLVQPGVLLGEVRRRLAPGGVVAVALPNVLFYQVRFAALLGRFEYTEGGILDSTHVYHYTAASGAALLRRHGFRILAQGAEGGVPLWVLRRVLPQAWQARIDAAACRLWPGLFGYQSLYLAEPESAT